MKAAFLKSKSENRIHRNRYMMKMMCCCMQYKEYCCVWICNSFAKRALRHSVKPFFILKIVQNECNKQKQQNLNSPRFPQHICGLGNNLPGYFLRIKRISSFSVVGFPLLYRRIDSVDMAVSERRKTIFSECLETKQHIGFPHSNGRCRLGNMGGTIHFLYRSSDHHCLGAILVHPDRQEKQKFLFQ